MTYNNTMLPNLIIIGAQKCGTTSLHYYLKQHPEIFMTEVKELNFFNGEFNWKKGRAWYEAQFSGQAKIYGESSPHYTNFPMFTGVPAKMNALVPNAKLIYLVRDPITRIVSQYLDYVKGCHEPRTIEEALIDLRDNEYLNRSQYYFQLEQFLKFYKPEQILVLESESLMIDREPTLKEIYHFLGVDESFKTEKIAEEKNVNAEKLKRRRPRRWVRRLLSDHPLWRAFKNMFPLTIRQPIRNFLMPKGEPVERPSLSTATEERLKEALRDDMKKLRAFTGKSFSQWRV